MKEFNKEFNMEEKRLVWGHRGGAARLGFRCALLVFALALTGCRFVQEFLGIGGEEPDPPAPAPEAEWIISAVAFSNAVGEEYAEDSAIDLIKGNTGVSSVLVQLPLGDEPVSFDAANDIDAIGLELTHTGDSETDTSPAVVIIDGGGRVVDLTGSPTGAPLITVGDGVTLTLRNIVFKGLDSAKDIENDTAYNTAALVKVESGGHLFLETGAEIRDNYNATGLGGGVYVEGGTFTMKNGSIISGNTSLLYEMNFGGGVLAGGGTFNMEGGTISGNTADDAYGGGVFVYGVYDPVSFTKTGGVIYGQDDVENANHVERYDIGYAVHVIPDNWWRNDTAGRDVELHWPLKDDETDKNWINQR